jgi:hypothetical protein
MKANTRTTTQALFSIVITAPPGVNLMNVLVAMLILLSINEKERLSCYSVQEGSTE